MKRRTFLTASSTIGIAGIVPGGFAASSIYTSISTSVLFEEFNNSTKGVFDKFMSNAVLNTQELGLDKNLAKRLVTPVQIINKKSSGDNHSIIYKNQIGEYVSLSITNGVERISISKTV